MHVAHVVGKWWQGTCDEFYKKIKSVVRQPTKRHKLKIVSDGNDQNENALLKYFSEETVDYAQVVKIRVKQKVIGIERRNVIGFTNEDKITINKIDSYCGTLRERIPFFVRRTKAFCKQRRNVENRLDIFQVNRNFIEKKKGKTPAMIEGITDKPWTWEMVLNKRFYPA